MQRDAVVAPNINQWTNYTDDYDVDCLWTSWGDSVPSCQQILHSNVEAGHMARSFPYVATNLVNGNVDRTTSEIEALFNTGANFPCKFGPGSFAAADAPTNFATDSGAGGGADHAGLAPRNAGRNPVVRAKLQLNGHDRFQERLGSYFNLVQPYQHHTNVPATGINVYSFALEPEKHQPSGTCNFSRIDSAVLQLQLTQKAAKGKFCLKKYPTYGDIQLSHIINSLILVSLLNCKEAKYLAAGNPLSFNNHHLQETINEIQGNDLEYGNIVKDWAIRRPTIYVQ